MAKPDRPLVEDAGVPRALREALQAARAREPREAELTQLAGSLGLALPPTVPPPVVPPATATGAAGLKVGLIAKGVAVLGAAALATTVVLKVNAPQPHAPPAPRAQEARPAALPSSEPAAVEALPVDPPATSTAPRVTRPHPQERIPVREAAPAVPSAEPEAPPAREPEPVAASDVASRLREEALLVRRAQTMLSSDPAGALRLTAERRRQFPGGVLGQEASVVAIEALLRLGRRQEAEAQARSFEAAHPGSVHARRMRRLLEGE